MNASVNATSGSSPAGASLAVFDFDGTVTRGESVFRFLVHISGFARVVLVVLPLLPRLLLAAARGGSTADSTKEQLFVRLLAGLPAGSLATDGRTFAARHLEHRLRTEVAERVEWHRRHGHRLVLVSASPEVYVKPAGDLLDFDAVLATRLAVDANGLLTGGYAGKNCRGSEKQRRLDSWMHSEGIDSAHTVIWAYGNGRGDLRLLEAADHAVDAGRLGPLGRLRRFPRLSGLSTAHRDEHSTRAAGGTTPAQVSDRR